MFLLALIVVAAVSVVFPTAVVFAFAFVARCAGAIADVVVTSVVDNILVAVVGFPLVVVFVLGPFEALTVADSVVVIFRFVPVAFAVVAFPPTWSVDERL